MKPRIYLKDHFYDCGWKYERWVCAGGMQVGHGSSPLAAYDDWKVKVMA